MDNRRHPRFPVRFHSSFSSINVVSGNGILHNLSLCGCQISSAMHVRPGTGMELSIEASDNGPPILISQAIVRWSRDGRFGLEFLDLRETEWTKLQRLVKELEKEPYQRQIEDEQSWRAGRSRQ
ncbi:MAG: PilZ domain-containing protein [Nitrospira sp.]|nr:PilZ domain-containing protein [Nitrospira sp.]MCP9442984.1 PilZ domain-containing protein [Nitrospira sp.]